MCALDFVIELSGATPICAVFMGERTGMAIALYDVPRTQRGRFATSRQN
jgi:hypothetical protein